MAVELRHPSSDWVVDVCCLFFFTKLRLHFCVGAMRTCFDVCY